MKNISISELASHGSEIKNLSNSEAINVVGGNVGDISVALPNINLPNINTQVGVGVPLSGNLVAGAVLPGGSLAVLQDVDSILVIAQGIS